MPIEAKQANRFQNISHLTFQLSSLCCWQKRKLTKGEVKLGMKRKRAQVYGSLLIPESIALHVSPPSLKRTMNLFFLCRVEQPLNKVWAIFSLLNYWVQDFSTSKPFGLMGNSVRGKECWTTGEAERGEKKNEGKKRWSGRWKRRQTQNRKCSGERELKTDERLQWLSY